MNARRVIRHVPIVHTHIDRYLKWLPALTVMVSRKLGLSTVHTTKDQLMNLGLSTVIMKTATQALKYNVDRARPGFPLDDQSFPSSHTAVAVAGAELLRRELAPAYRAWSWAAYAPAVITAALRISKRRHWPTDVMAGGIIGVGSVWLAGRILKRRKQSHKRPD